MSRVTFQKQNGKLVAHYRGAKFFVLDGLYDFSEYDLVTIKKFLLGGHNSSYYYALLNSLIVMRGLGMPDRDHHLLREIVSWPLSVQETTNLIMALPTLAKKYGLNEDPVFAKDNLTVSTLTTPTELPSRKAKSVIFSDLESKIRKAPENERSRLREDVCPSIVVGFRIMCALRDYNTTGWACSTKEDVWGYVSKYFPTSISTHVIRKYHYFDSDSKVVTLSHIGRDVYGPMFLYITSGYADIDRYVSMSQDSQVVIISDVELVTRLPFSQYTCEGKRVYLLNAPLQVKKLMCDKTRRCLFTDFFRPENVYRVTKEEDAGMLRSIKYLGGHVRVSGSNFYTREFNEVAELSLTDIGFIKDNFIIGLRGYVSILDGKYRRAVFSRQKQKVIEGTFMLLGDGDTCDFVRGSDGNRYAYATRSFKIRKKRKNAHGCVVSMYVMNISVYQHRIRTDKDFDKWERGEVSLPAYYIK